jgi:hypothetical protein
MGASHRSDEAVASTMSRLDEARRLHVIAQGLANVSQLSLECRVADVDTRPHVGDELFFRDEARRILDEISKHREGLRLQRDDLVATPQLLFRRIEAKRGEHEGPGGTHMRRGWHTPRESHRHRETLTQFST